jgi:pimeloyl-ACP methyl ester carboxylesterase
MTDVSSTLSDPFDGSSEIAVAGGSLHVAHAGARPGEADSVVLFIHGITATFMTWRSVARTLAASPDICLLAPDLRGRGGSASLPGPYGIAAHVEDLMTVLDQVGDRRIVLVGHSLGAYVAARLAAEHPGRIAALVLLDAGLPLPEEEDPEAMLQSAVASSLMRLKITFPSADDYVAGWRAHPAFARAWNGDVEAYARYDLVERDNKARCTAAPAAVRADSTEMVLDAATRMALDHVRADTAVEVLRAECGLFGDQDNPLISIEQLSAFATSHPEARVEKIPGVNHYTLVMGDSPGPARVAAAVDLACHAAL